MTSFRTLAGLALLLALAGCGSDSTRPVDGSPHASDSLEVGVGDTVLAPGVTDLVFTAALEPAQDGFVGTLTAANPTAADVTLEYAGICAVDLLIFAAADMGAPAVWDQRNWWNASPGGCKWMPVARTVPGNRTHTIRTYPSDAHAILGDSLAPGSYFAGVRLILAHYEDLPGGGRTTVVDSVFVTPAGWIELRREYGFSLAAGSQRNRSKGTPPAP